MPLRRGAFWRVRRRRDVRTLKRRERRAPKLPPWGEVCVAAQPWKLAGEPPALRGGTFPFGTGGVAA